MPRRTLSRLAWFSALAAIVSTSSHAQVANPPMLSAIDPPGATVGQSTRWVVSGRNLDKVTSLEISGGGVEVVGWKVEGEAVASAKVRVASDARPGFREVRLHGPSGVSNLAIIRVDTLDQVVEVEPNDELGRAQEIAVGSAVASVLGPVDLDHFRVRGTPGRRVTLDLEARRLGTSLSPVITVFSESGAALRQGRESRGGDGDCRMSVVIPPEGVCVVQVRDNQYRGNDEARYRLRVDPAPFATGLFPMGGIAGQTIEVELSCGDDRPPLRKSLTLPDSPGSVVDPGDFEGPGGPVPCPFRLIVGDGREVIEPKRGREGAAVEVASGVTINGRIGEPDEVDSYRIRVKAGDKLRARVEAESLGSRLDSVLALRDEAGVILAENDDSRMSSSPDQPRPVSMTGVPDRSTDSTLDYEAKADGVLTIDLFDRFGDGGAGYGYQLRLGPARPDFSVTLQIGLNAPGLGAANQGRVARTTPGQSGAFNLRAGGSAAINFLVSPEGRPGPIEVAAEGLPEGVTCDPVIVRLGGPPVEGSSTNLPTDASASTDFLVLKVAPDVQPGLFEFRVVARSKSPGMAIVREATAIFGVGLAPTPSPSPGRPITRSLSRFPLKIIGEARPRFVGPPLPPTLRSVRVTGPLLQGGQVDLTLDFSHPVSVDDGSNVQAKAEGVGLSANTVISAGPSMVADESARDVVVHVLASSKAVLGPHPVKVTFTAPGGSPVEREVMVEVKAPIEVRAPAGAIFLKPGDHAMIRVDVVREKSFEGEVELKVEGLPRGVKAGKAVLLAPGASTVEVRLEMNPQARPIAEAAELRVVGVARMTRGPVSIESKIRPMLRARPAEN